jgi:hypothetical protein
VLNQCDIPDGWSCQFHLYGTGVEITERVACLEIV